MPQEIASFDVAETPASIALIIDASPSIYRELGQMREVARSLSSSLGVQDEVAVLAFSEQTHLLLPFSRDRGLLSSPRWASPELARVADSSQSFIYQAVYLTAHKLFPDRTGRKAIVLLTDGQDSGLGLTWDPSSMQPHPGAANALAFDDVARELARSGVELYVISTENRPSAMTDAWLAAHQRASLITSEARKLEMPHYTLYLAEMARQAGGGLYFMRELGGLAEVYHQIRPEARRRIYSRILSLRGHGTPRLAHARRSVAARRKGACRRKTSCTAQPTTFPPCLSIQQT